MSQGYYTTSVGAKAPLSYHASLGGACAALPKIQREYPGARIMSVDGYFRDQREQTLAKFPLREITEEFYDEMLGVLPPVTLRGCDGFFISEAVTEKIHAQFIRYDGRYFAGYADLSKGGRVWTLRDAAELAAEPAANTPLSWYPPECD